MEWGKPAAAEHGQRQRRTIRLPDSAAGRKRESTMIDPKTDPGSEQHETIEHYDLEVAPRVRNLPPYLFGRINELKYRKRRDGIDVIDLGMGNPTDPPEEWVIDKLCEAARDSRNHRYSAATGIYNLRREVANRYESRFGVSLDPDQEVVATIGSKEGFSHMCLALLGPGDTALVPAPSFPIHIHAVALASANVISLDVRDGSSFPGEHRPDLREPVSRGRRSWSSTIRTTRRRPWSSRPFFEEIVALAKKYRFFVIHDFAYGDIGFDGYQPPSFLSVKGAKSVGCEFTTMSKGYNMAGWRVGFAAGNRDMLARSRRSRAITTTGSSRRSRSRRSWPCGTAKRAGWPRSPSINCGATPWFAASNAWAGTSQLPKAGMFVWTAIPEPWRSQSGSIDFAMKLLEDANVAVSPGRGFGETGEGFLRLALVENEQRLRQAVRQIARYLRPEKAAPLIRRTVAGWLRCVPARSGALALLVGRGTGGDGRLGGLNGIDPAEDHPAGAGLEHARHRQAEGLAQVIGSLLGDDHRAVVEIADALALLFAALEELDRQALAREHDRLHRVGQVVEVDDFDSLEPGDLVEVVVVGDDLAPEMLGQDHQALIDFADPRQLGDLAVVDPDLDARRLLQAVEDVEPAAPAVAPQLVGAVGDALQFLEHEPRNDHRLIDDARLGDVGDPPVDHDRGIEHQRTRAFDLLREFHVGDDEPKIVLGLEERRDADIADEDRDEAS